MIVSARIAILTYYALLTVDTGISGAMGAQK